MQEFKENLTKARNLVNELLQEHGLAEKGWTFKGFDSSKRRAGVCSYSRKTKCGYIGLSHKLTVSMVWEDVWETITHEVAHAIDYDRRGTSDHSWAWKQIHRELGGNGERCYESEQVINPDYNYISYCEKCQKDIGGFYKQPKRLEGRYHRNCGGKVTIREAHKPKPITNIDVDVFSDMSIDDLF